MDASEEDDREGPVRAAHARADFDAATTIALRLYGAEVFGYLIGVHRDEAVAQDAFSLFAERLWKATPGFAWGCSMRTYAYVLARRAAYDARHARKQLPRVALSDVASQLVARIRTETLSYLRDERRDAVARLRDELPEADRVLLVLRVDRTMAWNELARVFLDAPTGEPSEDALKREAARLRKRFQVVKEMLLEMGRARGLFRDR